MWELVVFALIATAGGLLGAGFVSFNTFLAKYRARFIVGTWQGLAELLCLITLVSFVSFFLPLYAGECRPVPTDLDEWSSAGIESLELLVTLDCNEDEYNELGTLFLNEPDAVIKMLLHFGCDTFKGSTLLLFSAVYLSLECLTVGALICSGLFIPSLLSGAAFGRGIGVLLGRNPRSYALVGAGAILGGIARMAISITVIMVEASGWVLFVIPMMVVFLLARSVGNRFNEGIYDTQIRTKKMPFLEQEPPEVAISQNLRVNQLMTKKITCLRPIEAVHSVHSTLRDCDHNCFPVVDKDNFILLGTVHR
ncbi:unnamed protein product [Choristocarpus tenellus]